MTKTLLSIILSVFTTGVFYAQTLELSLDGSPVTNGQTIVVSGEPTEPYIQKDFVASSSSPDTIMVRMVRYELNAPSTGADYFCWFSCYPSFPSGSFPVWQDDDLVPLKAHVSNVLSAYYVPNGHVSSASYRYVLYDENNPNDSISLFITFEAGPVTVGEVLENNFPSVHLYPNPSNGKPNLQIKAYQNQKTAELHIINMLGEHVYVRNLAKLSSTSTLDLSSLGSGLYFYNVSIDGKVESTQRLIIK